MSKPFYQIIVDQAPVTYERNLVIALIHSHAFYLAVKDKLCPWDAERATHRPDFSVPQYNIAYEAITHFWSLFGKNVSKQPIPKQHLTNIIIDWNNTYRINTTMAQQLLDELNEDLYNTPVSEDFIEKAIAGPVFAYWLETRLSRKSVDEIANKSRSMIMTLDTVEEILEKYKAQRVESPHRQVRGHDVLTGKIKVRSKLKSSIAGLDKALGGGFGYGEGSLIAGCNAAGKTVIACQLAYDFIRDGRNVIYVTTEQPPEELVSRIVSNALSIKYEMFTMRDEVKNTLQKGEVPTEKEVTVIPEWMWLDQNHSANLECLRVQLEQHFLYFNWADGGGLSVPQNFEAEVEKVVAKGFEPDVVIFDWIGGGLDYGKTGKDLRLLYQEAADHLINHGKRCKRVMIALAQLDRTMAMGKKRCGSRMLSECKTMPNNMTHFIGISAATDNAGSQVFSMSQELFVEKARNGIGGPVAVDRCFQFQRFVGKTFSQLSGGGGR